MWLCTVGLLVEDGSARLVSWRPSHVPQLQEIFPRGRGEGTTVVVNLGEGGMNSGRS